MFLAFSVSFREFITIVCHSISLLYALFKRSISSSFDNFLFPIFSSATHTSLVPFSYPSFIFSYRLAYAPNDADIISSNPYCIPFSRISCNDFDRCILNSCDHTSAPVLSNSTAPDSSI